MFTERFPAINEALDPCVVSALVFYRIAGNLSTDDAPPGDIIPSFDCLEGCRELEFGISLLALSDEDSHVLLEAFDLAHEAATSLVLSNRISDHDGEPPVLKGNEGRGGLQGTCLQQNHPTDIPLRREARPGDFPPPLPPSASSLLRAVHSTLYSYAEKLVMAPIINHEELFEACFHLAILSLYGDAAVGYEKGFPRASVVPPDLASIIARALRVALVPVSETWIGIMVQCCARTLSCVEGDLHPAFILEIDSDNE